MSGNTTEGAEAEIKFLTIIISSVDIGMIDLDQSNIF